MTQEKEKDGWEPYPMIWRIGISESVSSDGVGLGQESVHPGDTKRGASLTREVLLLFLVPP